jgi:CheY-like chemotaxis protein
MSEVWRDPANYTRRLYDGAPAAHASIGKSFGKRAEGTQGDGAPEAGPSPPRVTHTSEGPPAGTVYVIDDDASVRRALGRRLKLTEWQITTFDSAEAFLADLDNLVPACLVLDIQLGGMSGLDLLAHMKNVRPAWPIVAMSGSDDDSLEAEALRLGARAFLRKPFDSDLLIDAIAQAFA